MLGDVKAAGKMKDEHPDEEHEAGKARARESNSGILREMTNRGATQIPWEGQTSEGRKGLRVVVDV